MFRTNDNAIVGSTRVMRNASPERRPACGLDLKVLGRKDVYHDEGKPACHRTRLCIVRDYTYRHLRCEGVRKGLMAERGNARGPRAANALAR